jgi:uncharacterized delta-60 repeat protein
MLSGRRTSTLAVYHVWLAGQGGPRNCSSSIDFRNFLEQRVFSGVGDWEGGEMRRDFFRYPSRVAMGALGTLLTLALLGPAAEAEGLRLDRGFGDNGRTVLAASELPQELRQQTNPLAIAPLPGGGLVAATRTQLIALGPKGKPNERFGANGRVQLPSREWRFLLASLAVDSQGRILVAGSSVPTAAAGSAQPRPDASAATVYRYLPNGRLDPAFGEGGAFLNQLGQGSALAPGEPGPYEEFSSIQPSANVAVRLTGIGVDSLDRPVLTATSAIRLIRCPFGSGYWEITRSHLARLTTEGSLDPGFAAGGVFTNEQQREGTFGGIGSGNVYFTYPTEYPCAKISAGRPPAIAAVTDSGSPSYSFLTGEPSSFGHRVELAALAIDGRGRIVTLRSREGGDVAVSRWRPGGAVDTRFGTGGMTVVKPPGGLAGLAVDDRGRIALAGSMRSAKGGRLLVMRLNSAGRPQKHPSGRWSGATIRGTDEPHAVRVAVDARGGVIVAGTVAGTGAKGGFGLAFARFQDRP